MSFECPRKIKQRVDERDRRDEGLTVRFEALNGELSAMLCECVQPIREPAALCDANVETGQKRLILRMSKMLEETRARIYENHHAAALIMQPA